MLLSRNGVLGVNRRNLNYLFMVNERKKYPLVDDKILTKKLLIDNGLPVPKLYTVFSSNSELRALETRLASLTSFVVKPAKGACGQGVLILQKERGGLWSEPGGGSWNLTELRQHISSTISGIFSLAGQPDVALIEEKIEPLDIFQAIAPGGLADIRVVIYKGVPAMSMLRLPTFASNGHANLHQGAIGVGIDMVSGLSLSGVHRHRLITTHPDTDRPVRGLRIPRWDKMMLMAAKTYDVVGLGYLGVDIVTDKDRGPLILELNARPGLSIQIANSTGLNLRLQAVDQLNLKNKTAEERIKFVNEINRVDTRHLRVSQ